MELDVMTHCKREIPNILFLKEMNIQLLSLMTNLSTETDSSVDTQLGGKKDRYRVILRLPHAISVIITLVYSYRSNFV